MTRKMLSWLGTILVSVLLYLLFEPIARHNFGWRDLPAPAAPDTAPVTGDSALATADQLAREAYASGEFPALGVAVRIGGETVYEQALGWADIGASRALTTETPMRIGSVAKPLTATIAARLVDEGVVSLDKSMAESGVDFPAHYADVTLRQLLSHTAGVRNYGLCLCFPVWEFYSKKMYADAREAFGHVADSPLLFEPGSDFAYSTYNYVAAGALLTALADESYPALLERTVTRPLGLSSTTVDTPANAGDAAVPYAVDGSRYKRAFPVNNSNKWAGGGLLSTPGDLAKLAGAWLANGYISAATRAEFLEPQRIASGDVNPQYYALGWRHHDSARMFDGERPVRLLHHGGTGVGGTAFLAAIPDYDVVIAVITNRTLDGSGELLDIVIPIAEAFVLEADRATQAIPAPQPVP